MSNASKIMAEIDLLLDKSMLKKSKITSTDIINFIEQKWQEADDEKYNIYDSIIYIGRMTNEYIKLKDFDNMMRWLAYSDLHSSADRNPLYIHNYYKGECCLECGNEKEALKYFQLCYAENPDYIFTRAPFCYEFFNKHLANPQDLPASEDDEYNEIVVELKNWQSFFKEDDSEFICTILSEDGDELDEPLAEHEKGLIYLEKNQKKVLENILKKLLDEYPKMQEIYGYEGEEKEAFMPDISDVIGFAPLLTPTSIYLTSKIKDGIPFIGFGFWCPWDREHGLGFMTHKDEVIEMGGAETAFMIENIFQNLIFRRVIHFLSGSFSFIYNHYDYVIISLLSYYYVFFIK